MKFFNLYVKGIEQLNEWIGKFFSWVVLVLIFFTVLEVILRKFFNAPTIWSFETCTQLFGLNIMMAAAYTLAHDGHVSVDILSSGLSPKMQAIVDIIGYLIFFFPFTLIVTWISFGYAQNSWEMQETSWSVFAPPLYPIKTVIPLSFLLLVLQGFAIIIKRVQTLTDLTDVKES